MLVSVVIQDTCASKFEEIEHAQPADCPDKSNKCIMYHFITIVISS